MLSFGPVRAISRLPDSAAQLASGTAVGVTVDWDAANPIAKRPPADLEDAIRDGFLPFDRYAPGGVVRRGLAVTAVRILVE